MPKNYTKLNWECPVQVNHWIDQRGFVRLNVPFAKKDEVKAASRHVTWFRAITKWVFMGPMCHVPPAVRPYVEGGWKDGSDNGWVFAPGSAQQKSHPHHANIPKQKGRKKPWASEAPPSHVQRPQQRVLNRRVAMVGGLVMVASDIES